MASLNDNIDKVISARVTARVCKYIERYGRSPAHLPRIMQEEVDAVMLGLMDKLVEMANAAAIGVKSHASADDDAADA
jgi:hypothetical protein